MSTLACWLMFAGMLGVEAQGFVPSPGADHQAWGTRSAVSPRWREHTFDKTALHAEFDGETLWVGTEFGGVYRWNTLSGESRNFTRVNDELLSNTVIDLAVGKGQVWAAHWNGLSHHDGTRWQTFDASNSPLSSALALALDAQGNTWIGTGDSGLFRFDGTTWTQFSTGNSELSDDFVTSIEIDAAGALWIGVLGAGVDRFDGSTWSNFRPGNSGLFSPFVWVRATHPTDGGVWFYCHDDDFDPDVGIVQFDGVSWQSILPPGSGSGGASSFAGPQPADGIHTEYIHSIVVDTSGSLWFQGAGAISRLTGTDWSLFDGVPSVFDFSLPHGNALAVSASGALWTATAEGIARFDGAVFEPHATPGLWDMDIADVTVDPTGAVWMATRAGLQRLVGDDWTRFTSADSPLPSDDVDAVATIPTGGVLAGTRLGAARLEGRQWSVWTPATSGIHSDKITAVGASSSGALWFGSGIFGGGVSRLEDGLWTNFTTQNSGLASNGIQRIVGDPFSDAVWFASSSGASSYENGQWSFLPVGQPVGDTLNDLAFTPDGDVWFARRQGVSRLSNGVLSQFSSADGLAENWSNAVSIDALGRIWIGHHDEGLSRFDGSHWTTLDFADGLTNDRVKAIDLAPDGALWFATGINAGAYQSLGW